MNRYEAMAERLDELRKLYGKLDQLGFKDAWQTASKAYEKLDHARKFLGSMLLDPPAPGAPDDWDAFVSDADRVDQFAKELEILAYQATRNAELLHQAATAIRSIPEHQEIGRRIRAAGGNPRPVVRYAGKPDDTEE